MITEQLLTLATATPPQAARDVMALSVLDWAACGIAGAAEGSFESFAAQYIGAAGSGAVGTFAEPVAGPAVAALLNGTLSHALDFDDTHFDHIGHPSVVTVSAAMAVGQALGGTEHAPDVAAVIDAALIGAEGSVAVGLWLGRAHYQVGYHQTATAGAFGATLTAGRLLALDTAQMRHALGLCATAASGLKGQFGTMGKPLNAGLAARCGVEAAYWAQAGVTSAHDGLAGPLGFGATHHGASAAQEFDWRMERVSHKFHACCHGLHAALEAVAGLDFRAAQTVRVHTHPRWLTVCNQPQPDTGLGAKFSYAQVLAMAAHGIATGDITQFNDQVACDPALVAFRDRVEVVGDDSLSEMQARVEIDGSAYNHDLNAPLPLAERRRKIMQKARALVGARADEIAEAMTQADVETFARALFTR